jgi:hypothetical protein
MNSKRAALYTRVSTVDQNLDTQLLHKPIQDGFFGRFDTMRKAG